MEQSETINVYMDIAGEPVAVGTLRSTLNRGMEKAGFVYSDSWLTDKRRFQIDPSLPLTQGAQYPKSKSLFNVFGDASPDRWGRYLITRAEKRAAEREGRQRRKLFETDFLLGVHDINRMGALRLTRELGDGEQSTFLADDSPAIPPLVDLRKLQDSVIRIEGHREQDEDLSVLLAPGGSLGGARPKAVVRGPEGQLMVAKFEREQDDWPVIRWETLMLMLAGEAGIRVPGYALEMVDNRAVLLMDRFDRRGDVRIPFASALTMLEKSDGDPGSYLEIAEAVTFYGAAPDDDLAELWRRMVFNVLVSNTDDHLRNHGFLYDASGPGWRLSPAYDMNPVPAEVGPRVSALELDDDGDRTASLEVVMGSAEYFRLDDAQARQIAGEVASAVSQWQHLAHRVGLSSGDLSHMESAFDHGDIELALDF